MCQTRLKSWSPGTCGCALLRRYCSRNRLRSWQGLQRETLTQGRQLANDLQCTQQCCQATTRASIRAPKCTPRGSSGTPRRSVCHCNQLQVVLQCLVLSKVQTLMNCKSGDVLFVGCCQQKTSCSSPRVQIPQQETLHSLPACLQSCQLI